MFRRKTIVLSVYGVFSIAGCASLSEQAGSPAWQIEPSYGVKHSIATREGMYRLGQHFKGRVRYDQAIAAYRAALEQDPGFADAHNGLGVVYARQGRYGEAIQEFQKAISIAPRLAYFHNNLGYVYLLQGSSERAVNALEEARRLDPGNERVLHNLKLAHQSIEKSNAAHSVREPMVARASTPQPAPSAEAAPAQARSAPDDGIALVTVAPNVYELRARMSRGAGESAAVLIDLPRTHENPVAEVKPFRLEVSNGNGVTGMAQRVAERLERVGVKTARLTNALPFRQTSTEIQYRKGYRAEAARLGAPLGAPLYVVENGALRNDIHVRLVLGRDVRSYAALFEPGGSKVQIAARGDVKTAR